MGKVFGIEAGVLGKVPGRRIGRTMAKSDIMGARPEQNASCRTSHGSRVAQNTIVNVILDVFHLGRRAALMLLLGLTVSTCGAGDSESAAYGTKVGFKKGAALSFPDFALTYLGKRHVDSPVFKPGFNYEDFRVSRGNDSITVSWSSGTGLLGPQEFKFGGGEYELELRHTDKLGWLKDNEVVVVKK